MKKLFIAAVLGLDAMYRFWEKIKDVRESFVENNKKEKYADEYEKTLRVEKLFKISSVVLEMAELLAYMFLDGVDYKVASDEQAVREKT